LVLTLSEKRSFGYLPQRDESSEVFSVIFEERDHLVLVCLNRPVKMNTLTRGRRRKRAGLWRRCS